MSDNTTATTPAPTKVAVFGLGYVGMSMACCWRVITRWSRLT
jgi:UDP-N-acetyl-D-mannosaminuronate dehydrogenase